MHFKWPPNSVHLFYLFACFIYCIYYSLLLLFFVKVFMFYVCVFLTCFEHEFGYYLAIVIYFCVPSVIVMLS